MSGMRRADRRDSNDDNARKYPPAPREEGASPKELKQQLMNVRGQRDEAWLERDKALKSQQKKAAQLVHVEKKFQNTLYLYKNERERSTELLVKYKEIDSQRIQYLTLYGEAQTQLKYERRSKAGIRGWETRRKNENERLKQEIAEMVVLLRDSLTRKDEAVSNLYGLADRMDKIQKIVDFVDEGTTPVDRIQKLIAVLNQL